MAKPRKQARLLVRYGKHKLGETIAGDLADKLIAEGMAVDITPKPKRAKKVKGPAPENKKGAPPKDKDEGFDPNAD
jgi:hypothetical protein